ncbi:MAG: Fur family transcriptional regulator [Dermatophilaceae bacterium]
MEAAREHAVRQLRAAGLRVTAPRIGVLVQLAGHPHTDVESLASALRRHGGSVSTQAVYDVLRALTDHGLVRRIEPAGSPARFEVRVGDNHHHLVCRLCGAIEDVDCAVGAAPCLEAVDAHGYLVEEADVIYWGRCAACQQHQPLAAPDDRVGAVPPVRGGRTAAVAVTVGHRRQ